MLSVKEEKSGSPIPKSRGGLRSSKNKNWKNTEIIDLDSQSEGMEQIYEVMFTIIFYIIVIYIKNNVFSFKQGLKKVAEEKKAMYVDLQDVMTQKQTVQEKYTAVRQEVLVLKKEIQDLKASIKIQVEDTIDNAKHSTIISILHAKIQMASEAGDKGLDLQGKHIESWKQTLESMEGKEEATIVEKVAGKADDVGTSAGEKVEVEGTEVPGVGNEGYDTQA